MHTPGNHDLLNEISFFESECSVLRSLHAAPTNLSHNLLEMKMAADFEGKGKNVCKL